MPITKERLLSLDVMRGITIACMILVNTPGSWSYLYAPLSHAAWDGMTPTDVIFPFFLFMVGLAMSFGLGKMQSMDRPQAILKIVKRGALLFLIGYLIHAFPFFDFMKARIPGVLQRIGLAYIGASILAIYLNPKQLFYTAVAILLGYWAILQLGSDPLTLSGNIVRDIDMAVFGKSHIWAMHGADGKVSFDPEGLLSTLPSIVTVLIGLWAGFILRKKEDIYKRLTLLSVVGAGLILGGLAWHGVFPINKALWSSSYVMVSGGIAMLFLLLLTWIIDVKGYKKWTSPFVVYGSNALFAYCLAEMWAGAMWTIIKIPNASGKIDVMYMAMFTHLEPVFGPYNGSLIFALFHVVLFWLILLPLYKKKIFIKI